MPEEHDCEGSPLGELSEADVDDIHAYYSDGRDYWSDFQLESVNLAEDAADEAAEEFP